MTPARYEQINQLFLDALDAPETQRATFLQQVCTGDEELRQAVERLLEYHARADGILDQPLAAVAALVVKKEEPATLQAGQQLGRYQVTQRLGAGGMGEIYLAQDLTLDRKVALKILPPEFTADADRLHRFAREAKAASALNHPNIITIYEIGEAAGVHFIATEFIEGETLRQRLQRGSLPVHEALEAVLQATAAIAAAHQAGIIHRDLKPENLMLRPDGYLKVLDFGLARVNKPADPSGELSTTQRFLVTHPGTVLGTPLYMSPEQARGERVDERTDLWSLGVVLYELLTGVRPFNGATLPDFMVALLERDPAPLASYLPYAPVALDELLHQLLAKDRERRLATAQVLRERLKELLRQVDALAEESPTKVDGKAFHETPVSSEAPTLTALPPATLPRAQNEEQITLRLQAYPTVEQTKQREPVTDGISVMKPTRLAATRGWLGVAALIFLLGLATWLTWPTRSTPSPTHLATLPEQLPERTFSYYLTFRQKRNGRLEEFRSTGEGETFAQAASFKLNITNPQAGFLYLLNAEPTANGEDALTLLFPLNSVRNGSAQLAAGENLATSDYNFTQTSGTDRFLIVWGAQPIPALEAVRDVVNAQEQGRITQAQQLADVRAFLRQHPVEQFTRQSDSFGKLTTIRGRGDVLIAAVTLKHN